MKNKTASGLYIATPGIAAVVTSPAGQKTITLNP